MSANVEIRRNALRSTGLVGSVAIAEYGDRGGLRDRRHVLRARSRFVELCDRLGFGRAENLEGDGTLERVDEGLRRFVAADAARKILYWTGHGHASEEDGYVLACRGSYEPGRPHPVATRAMPFTRLLERLAQVHGSELLVIVDACESQQTLDGTRGLHAALRRYREASRETGPARDGFMVLATAGADRSVEESLWVDWFQDTLADRSLELDGTVRPFEPTAPFLLVPDLLEAIDRRAVDAGYEDATLRPSYVEVHSLTRRFLHNPHYDSSDAVYRSADLPPDQEPWLAPEQFGPVNDGLLPSHFSGRVRPLSRLVTWTASQSRGMLVVTGPAGTGKTALLARLALLSVRRRMQALDPAPPPQTVPRPGSIHGAVSCHGMSLHSLAHSLLRALAPLGAEVPHDAGITAREAVERISALVPRVGGVTLLVDGLDEAMPGQAHEIARRLLNPLSRCPGVKLVVGTRAHPRRAVDGGARESLIDALDGSSPVLDLDHDRDTERDVAALVAILLADTPRSPYAGPENAALRREAAALVARRCGRRFLVARLAARALARQPAPLSTDALDLFVQRGGGELRARMADELNVLDPGDRDRYAELLLPLAVVQGPGLADPGLWLTLANKLRRRRTPEITREMLDAMLHQLKRVLITTEGRPGLPPLHRLDHASYGTALLERARLTEGAAHRRVFDALHRPAGDWEHAHDYTLAYLGAHAAQVPVGPDDPPDEQHPLEQLFLDPEFLVRTDPDVMLPLTGQSAGVCEEADLYRRVSTRFRDHRSLALRRAVLAAEALVGHPDLHEALDRLPGFAERGWREVWTNSTPRAAELTLPAPLGGALAVDWSRAGLLSLAGRGEIVGRRAETGAYVHTRRAPQDRAPDSVFTAVRAASLRGRRITASHDGRSLYLWWGDERLPRRTYNWDGSIGALDAAPCGDGVQIVAADGRRVWAWRLAMASGGAPGDQDVRHDVLSVSADRVALLALRDRCFLLTAAGSLVLHELHGKLYADRPLVRDGREFHNAPDARYCAAAALAEDADHGFVAVAEAGTDRDTVTVWRVSAPGHGDPDIVRVARFDSPARQIALGKQGAVLLLALHEGGRVRVRSLTDDTVDAVLRLAAPRGGLAFDPAGTGRLAVGDGDEVRVVDTAALNHAGSASQPLSGEAWPRIAVATASTGSVLLVRATGARVLLGVHTPLRGQAGPEVAFSRGQRVTAVSALWHDGAWHVAAAAGRRVRLWRLAEDLTEWTEDDPVELGGDVNEIVPGLALVPAIEGGCRLFVPDGWRVVPYGRKDNAWTAQPAIDAAQVKVCEVAARTVDGQTWVVANCGDALTLWKSTASGFRCVEQRAAAPDQRVGVILTTRLDGGVRVPLLAWTEAGTVRLAEYNDGEWSASQFSSPHGPPTALAFAGTARQPLLLAFGGTGTVTMRDVAGEARLDELAIPYRGTEVQAANAVHSPRHGLTLFVQGRDRCDQVRIPQDRLAAALRRG
ncbi:AAA family ATPase [Streptomyces sp. NPDC087843]|uniref:AAA family ATPase n=1 Tax=Streptomyces sp. NPDC087843 TaxID=3365804 RepID=UPI00382036DC